MKTKPQSHYVEAPAKPGTPDDGVRVPFEVNAGGADWPVSVESDGNSGTRFYFNHPTERVTNQKTGKSRKKKIHNKSRVVITKLLTKAVLDMQNGTVTLKREEYLALKEGNNRLERLESGCRIFGFSAEIFLGQVLPAFSGLPANVSPSQVVNEGKAHFVPAKPMTVQDVFDELFPCLQTNALSQHSANIKYNCAPLLERHGDTYFHLVDTPELESLLASLDRGEHLSPEEKERLLRKRQKEIKDPRQQPQIVSVYHDKTRKHYYDAWRRLYLRAFARGAWPLNKPLPTSVMEKPRAGRADGKVISVKNWKLLLPILDPEERRLVTLLASDIRPSELDRSKTSDIVPNASTGLPGGLNIPPAPHAKESEGRFAEFCPTTAVLLNSCMPTGVGLFDIPVNEIMKRIYEKADAHGIKLNKNCFRYAHDTYWYALMGGTQQLKQERSHDAATLNLIYRRKASLTEGAEFWRTLTDDIPEYQKKWVLEWVDEHERKTKGAPLVNPSPSGKGSNQSVVALKTPGSNGPSTGSELKSYFKGKWPLLKSEFLELLWAMPATQIAKRIGVSDVAVRKHALALKLPYPDRSYRAKMGRKLPVQIPEHIVSLLAQLRDEEQVNQNPGAAGL